MPAPIDRTGHRFSRLLVLGPAPSEGKQPRWHVRCDCGTEKLVYSGALTSGNTRSCGCLSREVKARKHAEAEARRPDNYGPSPKFKLERKRRIKPHKRMPKLMSTVEAIRRGIIKK